MANVAQGLAAIQSGRAAIATAINTKDENAGASASDSLQALAVKIEGMASGGLILNIASGALLPGTVTNGQIFVVTSQARGNVYFGYTAPPEPNAGDVWIHTVDYSGGYAFVVGDADRLVLKPGATVQWTGSAWVYRDAYIGANDTWTMFSTLSPLASLSWEQIIAIAGSGENPASFWSIGSAAALMVNGEAHTAQIVDFSHDTIAATGQKAAITFVLGECMDVTCAFSTSSGSGTWYNSLGTLRDRINGFKATMPAELQAAIKTVVKGTAGSSLTGSFGEQILNLDLWAVGVKECGVAPVKPLDTQVVYPWLNVVANKIKNRLGAGSAWWTRDCQASSSAAQVGTQGSMYQTNYNQTQAVGVVFGFCI
jgi:hypothetical protein